MHVYRKLDFCKLILNPEALQKIFRFLCISIHSNILAFVMMITSSTKSKCKIFINLETLIPDRVPSAWPCFNKILSPSNTRMNKKGDKGQPWCSPSLHWKNIVASPFINTAETIEDIQPMTQFVVTLPKPHCIKIRCKKSQLTHS